MKYFLINYIKKHNIERTTTKEEFLKNVKHSSYRL